MISLYPYQQAAVDLCLKRKYSILAYEMGLGKTYIALEIIRSLNLKAVVICPAMLKKNWLDEIEKFDKSLLDLVTVSSFSSFKKISSDIFNVVIIDEAHYIKNYKAKRTEVIRNYLFRNRDSLANVTLMSGTPIKNQVDDYYTLIDIIHKINPVPHFSFRNVFEFRNAFMNKIKCRFSPRGIKFEGIKNEERLLEILSFIQDTKKTNEVLDLPPMVKKQITLGYTVFDDELLESWEEKEHFMTVKNKVAMYSADYTAKFTKEIVDQGHQVVVFTDHIDSSVKLGKLMGVPFINGEVSEKKRNKIIEDFKDGTDKVLVATYKTASTGLTLTNAKYMVFNDLSYSNADMRQAAKRINRIGQDQTCFYYYINCSDIYEKIFKRLAEKQKVIDKV